MTTTEKQQKFAELTATKEVMAWLSEFQVQGTKDTYSAVLIV